LTEFFSSYDFVKLEGSKKLYAEDIAGIFPFFINGVQKMMVSVKAGEHPFD